MRTELARDTRHRRSGRRTAVSRQNGRCTVPPTAQTRRALSLGYPSRSRGEPSTSVRPPVGSDCVAPLTTTCIGARVHSSTMPELRKLYSLAAAMARRDPLQRVVHDRDGASRRRLCLGFIRRAIGYLAGRHRDRRVSGTRVLVRLRHRRRDQRKVPRRSTGARVRTVGLTETQLDRQARHPSAGTGDR